MYLSIGPEVPLLHHGQGSNNSVNSQSYLREPFIPLMGKQLIYHKLNPLEVE